MKSFALFSLLSPLLISLFILSACSHQELAQTPPESIIIADVCEAANAKEMGLNDGRNNKKMNASFLSTCDQSKRLTLRKAYKAGYLKGIKHSNRAVSGKAGK